MSFSANVGFSLEVEKCEKKIEPTRCEDRTHDPNRGPDLKSGALTTRPTWLVHILLIKG